MLTRTLRVARPSLKSARGFASSSVARNNVQEWIQNMTTRPPTVEGDVLHRGRADQLLRTLPTRSMSKGSAEEGGLLPKGHHMVYWQPEAWMEDLAPDGTSTEYNAPSPYTRRMWAGGAFEWRNGTGLRIGQAACQSSTVASAQEKSGMMFVYKEYKYFAATEPGAEEDWVMKEERTHVFFPEKNEAKKDSTKKAKKPSTAELPKPDYTFSYTPTSPLLFRFSALTWNAHKIHYDRDWTREVEGHPDLVVHGPLTAALLVELAGQAAGDVGANLARFEYRATSPMYVSKEIKLNAAWDGPRGKKLTLWADQEGTLGMKATATFE